MLKKLKQLNNKGFTIIEVLIVLAIAGLIMLIVFLAVPSLQRNSRNTQRKNDAAKIGGAIANFASNNSGALPTAVMNVTTGDTTSLYFYCVGATPATGQTAGTVRSVVLTTGCVTTNNNFETAKLGIYTASDSPVWYSNAAVSPTVVAPNVAATATNVNINSMVVNLGHTCNATGTGVGDVNARSYAMLYVLETSTGNGNLVCTQS